ncbi:glutamate--cysteine ligase [Kineosporia sp. R_H_3]|uniref:glutamate--cysteine ligase n=1 Tax=Kineosporia sp. R_H_3 TaxID=1961848 RepID=UPI000B4A79AA
MHVDFTPSPAPTLGVEWELGLVDAGTGDLVQLADTVLAALPGPDGSPGHPRIKQELLLNTVELVTGICANAAEARADLAGSLAEVRGVTDGLGVELFSAGTHPFAAWQDQLVAEGPRYATLIDRTQWWGRQMLIYGVHVHVGMPHRDAVLPVLSAMLAYHPHLQALSASSPFWAGIDTGYASNRALMFQQLPTAGLPFQFATWEQYEAYLDDVFTTGVIDELGELRWDLRPAPHLGTLEVRVADGVPTLREVTAIAALTHCLVVEACDRWREGTLPAPLPPWHVQENKWRAARYGTDAIVVLDAKGTERLVTDDVLDLVERLAPVARRLGCTAELEDVAALVAEGASYIRQRAVAAAHGGDLRAVVTDLVGRLRADVP